MLNNFKHSNKQKNNHSQHSEKRNHKRWLLMKPLKIYNSISGEYLGNITDISLNGIGMICKSNLPSRATLDLKIDLSDENISLDTIELQVRNIWIKEKLVNHYSAGMELKHKEDDLKPKIKELIHRYGFIS